MANVGLYRSNRSNMIAGVMGGIAERFGWNANLLRIVFITISLLSAAFPGILVLPDSLVGDAETKRPNRAFSTGSIWL